MKILVINAGSSSIKYQLFEMPAEKVLAKGLLEKIGEETSKLTHTSDTKEHKIEKRAADHAAGMKLILDALVDPTVGVIKDISEINAVGHRVVHGGEEFTDSCIINEHVIGSIERFADLAPLHNPPNLTGIKAAQTALPGVPQAACFDTAFHTSLPQTAFIYALPYEIYEKYRVRKYGFHGTSHKYVAQRGAVLLGKRTDKANLITCHLGNGCSMAAVKEGKSVDTSMGLTPLEGLVMGTRTGDFDPAILFYLSDKGYSVNDLNKMCNKASGLLGISGVSNDMRNLRAQADAGNKRAQLAIDIFCYRIKRYIGAYTAVVGRLDAIVFTGGIGENAPDVRFQSCGGLEQIGVDIDAELNKNTIRKEGTISTADSRVKVFVIPTNEELAIAQDTFVLTK
ncbi:MAG: Acetate kinase [Planctomycetes bacterium ADurb.Bin401]|nr:MAG: Acetate kinase [Planctomycetes bacterium ADurb.Bin401]